MLNVAGTLTSNIDFKNVYLKNLAMVPVVLGTV